MTFSLKRGVIQPLYYSGVLLLLLPILCISQAAWKRTQIAPDISVSAPIKLKLLVKDGDGKKAPKAMTYWTARTSTTAYAVSILPLAKTHQSGHGLALAAFRDATVKPGAGRLRSQKNIAIGSTRALEFDYWNSAGMESRWRAFVHGGKIYGFGATWIGSQMPSDVPKYQGSIQIKKK